MCFLADGQPVTVSAYQTLSKEIKSLVWYPSERGLSSMPLVSEGAAIAAVKDY